MTPMLEFLQPLSAQAEPLERMLALEQRFFLADHNLIYTDKMSMAVGVEVLALARRCGDGCATICVSCWAIGLRDERDEREVLAVQRLIAANDEGRVDASYTLLSLLCIDIWCRTFLDGIPRTASIACSVQR